MDMMVKEEPILMTISGMIKVVILKMKIFGILIMVIGVKPRRFLKDLRQEQDLDGKKILQVQYILFMALLYVQIAKDLYLTLNMILM